MIGIDGITCWNLMILGLMVSLFELHANEIVLFDVKGQDWVAGVIDIKGKGVFSLFWGN